MANRPGTFEEVFAAQDPAEREQRKRDERYRDRAVEQDVHADVWLVEDRNASGIWRVEYQDDNGGCYVTIFAGPVAEKRARTYFEALQGKRLPTFREGARSRERT
jgi:hypothetical protein